MSDSGVFGDDDSIGDEPFEAPVHTSERVFEGAVWDIRREEFEYNGSRIRRDFVDHTGAVAVLAIDADDNVLLIQQYRHPIRSREWEIPAGLLDVAGEDTLTAAQRELAEEADLVADHWSILTDVTTSPGGSDEVIRIFLARRVAATPVAYARTEEEADIVVRWVPLDDAVRAVRSGRFRNSVLQLAVLHAAASRAVGWGDLRAPSAPWAGTPRGGY